MTDKDRTVAISELERKAFEANNPKTLKDYCNYDGCPTTWYRMEDHPDKKGKVLYECRSCESQRKYDSKEPKR